MPPNCMGNGIAQEGTRTWVRDGFALVWGELSVRVGMGQLLSWWLCTETADAPV